MVLLVALVALLFAMSQAFIMHPRSLGIAKTSLNIANKAGGEVNQAHHIPIFVYYNFNDVCCVLFLKVFNKGDLVGMLAKTSGLPKEVAETFLVAYEKTLVNNVLGKKGEIRLKGFGTWKTSTTKERMARNPQNGEMIIVPEKTKLTFSVSKTIGSKEEKSEKKTKVELKGTKGKK